MIERIEINEKRLDEIKETVDNLEKSLNNFKLKEKDIILLEKYYGSKEWFKDKKLYEKKYISNVKAGVLSEDAVWNTLEDINELLNEMKTILKNYKKI